MNVKEIARQYIEKGFKVVPIQPNSKQPIAIKDWWNQEYTPEHFFENYGIGLLLGKKVTINGKTGILIDIDLDSPAAVRTSDVIQKRLGNTARFGHSAKPNSHLLYLVQDVEEVKSQKFLDIEHGTILEIRAKNTQTLAPPTPHEKGGERVWENGFENIDIATTTLERLNKVIREVAACITIGMRFIEHQVHFQKLDVFGLIARSGKIEKPEQLAELGDIMHIAYYGKADSRKNLSDAKTTMEDLEKGEALPGYTKMKQTFGEEVTEQFCKWFGIDKNTLASSEYFKKLKEQIQNVKSEYMCENKFAEIFVKLTDNQFMYIPEAKEHENVYRFNPLTNIWDKCEEDDILTEYRNKRIEILNEYRKMLSVDLEKIKQQFGKTPNPSDEKNPLSEMILNTENSIMAYAIKMWQHHNEKKVLENVKDKSKVSLLKVNQFEGKIPLNNGLFDLKTKTLEPYKKEYYITVKYDYDYVPGKRSAVFQKYFDEWTNHDKAVQKFLLGAIAYSLLSNPTSNFWFILRGPGGSGKSTFLDLFHHLMKPPYVQAIRKETLSSNEVSGTAPTENIARLVHARVVTSGDISSSKLNIDLVKNLTGGDTINARFLHKDSFDFKPKFVLWCSLNNSPSWDTSDDGLRRRIVMIPFDAPKTLQTRNEDLKDIIYSIDSIEGIFSQIVEEGLPYYEQTKLKEWPSVIESETQSVIFEANPIALFFEQNMVRTKDPIAQENQIPLMTLWGEYMKYAKDVRSKQYEYNVFKEKVIAYIESIGDSVRIKTRKGPNGKRWGKSVYLTNYKYSNAFIAKYDPKLPGKFKRDNQSHSDEFEDNENAFGTFSIEEVEDNDNVVKH